MDPGSRPRTVAILAQSLDGRISTSRNQRADFSSLEDQQHLAAKVAECDAVIMGAATLRAYGTSVRLKDPGLIAERHQRQQPPQPITIICSSRADLEPSLPFFRQPLPRWLWTTPTGSEHWQAQDPQHFGQMGFEQIWTDPGWNLSERLARLAEQGIRRVGILGGGQVVGAFVQAGLLDELWLTLCPLLLSGNSQAPASISHWVNLGTDPPRFQLQQVLTGSEEVFLHYVIRHLPRERA